MEIFRHLNRQKRIWDSKVNYLHLPSFKQVVALSIHPTWRMENPRQAETGYQRKKKESKCGLDLPWRQVKTRGEIESSQGSQDEGGQMESFLIFLAALLMRMTEEL
jgi:hypothetical protein